jgi:hypothetical protein
MYGNAFAKLIVRHDGREIILPSEFGEPRGLDQILQQLFLDFMRIFDEEFYLMNSLFHHPG